MRLNQFSKHFCHSDWGIPKTCILNASTASSGVEKRWTLILFLTCGNKKKSFGAMSGLYGGWLIKLMFWVLKNAVVWADVWELALWSMFGGWFSWFLGRQLANKWLCATQNWLFWVVLVVRLRHVQFFRKKQAIIRLEVLYARTTFVGFGSSWFISYAKSTIHHLSRYHRRVSKHRDHIFRTFLSINRHEPFFLIDWHIVWYPTRTNFFHSKIFMQHWMYAGPTNA